MDSTVATTFPPASSVREQTETVKKGLVDQVRQQIKAEIEAGALRGCGSIVHKFNPNIRVVDRDVIVKELHYLGYKVSHLTISSAVIIRWCEED